MSANDPSSELVDEVFDRLIELPLGERRAALEHEGLDDATRTLVERLLSHCEKASFADSPAVRGLPAPGQEIPSAIGPYRVRGVLGSGGMGIVYLAKQRRHSGT